MKLRPKRPVLTWVGLTTCVVVLNACSLSGWIWAEDNSPIPIAPPLPRWAQEKGSLVPRAMDQGYPLQSAADGVLIPNEPEQVALPAQPLKDERLQRMGIRLIQRARYVLRGRVLRTESYWFESGTSLVPVDVAMGWQAMSSNAVLRRLSIMQSDRFYMFDVNDGGPFPLSPRLLSRESSNNHLIPSTPMVLDQIRELEPGQLVEMSGYLVDAEDTIHRKHWETSLSRNDIGDGACELMYVTKLSWIQHDPIPTEDPASKAERP